MGPEFCQRFFLLYNLFKNFLIPFLFLRPLQCSCLENPKDGGALWADVYGFTQSQTRLKWLSSSSIWHCPRGLWDYPQLFSFFLLYSALQKLFPPFHLPAHGFHASASDILLLIPSRVFLTSVIMLFVSAYLFFNFLGLF